MKHWQKGQKMNQIINAYHEKLELSQYEQIVREYVVEDLRKAIESIQSLKLFVVGSYMCGTSIVDGDLDVVVIFNDEPKVEIAQDDNLTIHNTFVECQGANKKVNYPCKTTLEKQVETQNKCFDDFEKTLKIEQNQEIEFRNIEKCFNDDKNEIYSHDMQKELLIVSKLFVSSKFVIENILYNATFPILRLRSVKHGIKIDLSVNQYNAIKNTNLIKQILNNYLPIKQAIIIIKSLCKKFDINNSYSCTLSSYAITLMVIFYFQIVYKVPYANSKRKIILDDNILMINIIKEYFFYYGWVFDYENHIVSVKHGKYKTKHEMSFKSYNTKSNTFFCVEDPIVNDFNVTRTVNNVTLVKIINAHRLIYYFLSKEDLSILN